jgi:hypothetical protein
MHGLNAAQLLAVWERGLAQTPAGRTQVLLAAACPETPSEALSIGQRDARLLALREQTFGPQLDACARCPACAESLELSFRAEDVRVPAVEVPREFAVQRSGYELRFRLPTQADLEEVCGRGDVPTARMRLLERCLLTARRSGLDVAADQLPEDVVQAVDQAMAAADPQADVRLALACPACGHQWQEVFDIGLFLWSEVHSWALRLLREVHTLATAYGWSEADILALSPQRRRMYLELVSP